MSDLRIGIAGATGALGKEVLAVLDKAPWRPDKVVAMASAQSTVPHVEYGDEQLPVDDLAAADLEGLHAVVLAVPGDAAREVGERAIGDGVLVIDATGVFAEDDDVPLVVPWVNPEALGAGSPRGVYATPGAPAILLGSVLGPLRRGGLVGPTDATVMLPASAYGRAGIDELSRQVVALFNSATPPRKVFEQGLAFDVLPWVGAIGPDGWTDAEETARAQLRRLVGDDEPAAITLVVAPVFSGMGATVTLRLPADIPIDRIERLLQDGGVQLPKAPGARNLPRTRKVEGQPFVHVARVRRGGDGAVHLWAAMDNLRGSAAVAVSTAGALLRKKDR